MSAFTRFAPSPTGYLHLGHVVNALYVWRTARTIAGRVLLRIEDHDRVRCRPAYEAAIREDLAWLGFVPDVGVEPPVRQSDRGPIYEAALARLRQTAHVYTCDCSRKQVGGERYDGRCRERGLPDGPGRGLRVRIDPGVERFTDLLLGPRVQDPARQCGDVLIRDRDGHWTYQFAVTADDMHQGITHVIRGADLVDSTGRQLRLGRLLGRETAPIYLHHPLVLDSKGEKLSKSAQATPIREMRRAGLAPEAVIELADASLKERPHGF